MFLEDDILLFLDSTKWKEIGIIWSEVETLKKRRDGVVLVHSINLFWSISKLMEDGLIERRNNNFGKFECRLTKNGLRKKIKNSGLFLVS